LVFSEDFAVGDPEEEAVGDLARASGDRDSDGRFHLCDSPSLVLAGVYGRRNYALD
jgi:hypothetical protein